MFFHATSNLLLRGTDKLRLDVYEGQKDMEECRKGQVYDGDGRQESM